MATSKTLKSRKEVSQTISKLASAPEGSPIVSLFSDLIDERFQARLSPLSNTQKILDFSQDFKKSKSWCIVDENNEHYLLIPAEKLAKILQVCRDLEYQKFLFKLEKEILQEVPLDFDDAWCVAVSEAKKHTESSPKQIVQTIKKQYPNLFMDIDLPKSME